MLKTNSYYYIFYDGCYTYKPQWLFLNQHTIQPYDKPRIHDLIIDYTYRVDLTRYLKYN
jgi:hypothetical protein